jgi:guanylate kinase
MAASMGTLYVVAAPSGAGKTTLVQALAKATPNLTVSISHTTRPMRPNETHGVNYYFISKAEFERMTAHGDFLEHAKVFGNLYGTSKSWVEHTLAQGLNVILEIDWQGHQQIKQLFNDSISIFILPPSLQDLRERLIKRNQDKPEIIEQRLADVRETVSHIEEFDYIVINDDFERALQELKTIVESGPLVEKRQHTRHAKLIHDLVAMKP